MNVTIEPTEQFAEMKSARQMIGRQSKRIPMMVDG
jgi:hypothetical protein